MDFTVLPNFKTYNVPSGMTFGTLNSPPVDHHNQQHYEAEQSESRHHNQGDDPHHPAHPRVRAPGHVGQNGPVWNATQAHKYTFKHILLNYTSSFANFKVPMCRTFIKL